jgi:hypothetical protein
MLSRKFRQKINLAKNGRGSPRPERPGLGATTESPSFRLGRFHHTTARTAVMKAKAAQIERISTLIADVIDEPSRSSDETIRVRIGNSFSINFICEDLMNCKVFDSS